MSFHIEFSRDPDTHGVRWDATERRDGLTLYISGVVPDDTPAHRAYATDWARGSLSEAFRTGVYEVRA